MRRTAFSLLLLLPLAAGTALAQENQAVPGAETPLGDCHAEPPGEGTTEGTVGVLSDGPNGPSLQNCGDVFQPPFNTGGGAAVEPAPFTGEPPAIPPGVLPEQPSQAD